MVNYFVYSVRSLGLIFGLSNNERKGTKKYAHTQVSEHIFLKRLPISLSQEFGIMKKYLLPLHLKCPCKSLVILW